MSEPTNVPDTATPAPPENHPPAPKEAVGHRSGFRRVLGRMILVAYLGASVFFSLLVVVFVPGEGGPIGPYIPKDALIFLHARSGDALWRGFASDAGMNALWMNPELQGEFKWQENWSKKKAEHAENKLLSRFLSLDREGLRFLIGGETAFALMPALEDDSEKVSSGEGQKQDEKKNKKRKGKKPRGLIFLRLHGARGAMVRMAGGLASWIAAKKKKIQKEAWFDLGGGLVAFGFEGGRIGERDASLASAQAVRRISPKGEGLRIVVCPRLLKLQTLKQQLPAGYFFDRTPSFAEIFGIEALPEKIDLGFRALATGGWVAEGRWVGALPVHDPPARMIDSGHGPEVEPLLEIQVPISMRAAFARHVISEVRRSEKKNRRWHGRFGQLDDRGVDLDRDLWPSTGKTLSLKIVPPTENSVTKQGLVLFSLPFRATPQSRDALAQLAGVYWKGLFNKRAPAQAKKPYVVRRTGEPLERFMLAKGQFTRSMWIVSEHEFAFVSDAAPLMLMPQLEKKNPESDDVIFRVRLNGHRFKEQAAVIAQFILEGKRNDMGAAAYMEAVPDQEAVLNLARLLSRAAGKFQAELKAESKRDGPSRGRIHVRWLPRFNAE